MQCTKWPQNTIFVSDKGYSQVQFDHGLSNGGYISIKWLFLVLKVLVLDDFVTKGVPSQFLEGGGYIGALLPPRSDVQSLG